MKKKYDNLPHHVHQGPVPQFRPSRNAQAIADGQAKAASKKKNGPDDEIPPVESHSVAAGGQSSVSYVAVGWQSSDSQWHRRGELGGKPSARPGGASGGQPSDRWEEGKRGQSSTDKWIDTDGQEESKWRQWDEWESECYVSTWRNSKGSADSEWKKPQEQS